MSEHPGHCIEWHGRHTGKVSANKLDDTMVVACTHVDRFLAKAECAMCETIFYTARLQATIAVMTVRIERPHQ